MPDEKPALTEDDVARDFTNAIDQEVVNDIGHGLWLREYDWGVDWGLGKDDDDTWPFIVVRDGREFEVDIDVRVTELTPERKAARLAEEQRIVAMLARVDARKTGES
jgi:hypothetical protein